MLIIKKGLVWNVRFGSSLACGNNEMMIKVLRGGNKANSKIITIAFRKANFDLFRNLLERILWDTVLKIGDQGT